jgi:hypothetical protein
MLARAGMLVLWCLILWGTLYDLGVVLAVLRGGTPALTEALISPPRVNAAAAWGNRICGLLAVLAWTLVLGGAWSSSRRTA